MKLSAAPLLASAAIALAQAPAQTPAQTSAQTPATPSGQPTVLRTQTTLVLVPTLVRNHAGELVYTLTANDFTVTDDGAEQHVSLDPDTDNQPLALVVAIETGGVGASQLDKYRDLGSMIEAVVGGVEHRVAVITFDSAPRLQLDFTSDMNSVGAAVRGLAPGDNGAAILDGLSFSVDQLRGQPPKFRRAILLFSETIDHGSTVDMEKALRQISDTNTSIYSVAFSSSKAQTKREASQTFHSSTPGPPGGCMARDPDAVGPPQNGFVKFWDCLSLLAPPLRALKIAAMLGINGTHRNVPESVAHLTGGEYYKFSNEHALQGDLMTISNHVPNRYVLSFQPQSPHPGLHIISVRLNDHPNLSVTARNSYWADTGTATPAAQ